ncbi:unnamed protein product, partial [marine sediment metagenome]
MNKQGIEILQGILNYNEVHDNYDKRLVIIEPKEAITDRGSKLQSKASPHFKYPRSPQKKGYKGRGAGT